jgi:Tat protein translocase TatB subunit
MEVFGVGPFELLLVILIAFVILGPEKIPGVARSLGTGLRQIRQSIQNLTTDSGEKINLADDLAALRREVLGLQKDLTTATQGLWQPDRSTTPKDNSASAAEPTSSPDDSDIIDLGAPPPA